MFDLNENDPLAAALTSAIRTGDIALLQRLLAEHPGLASARIREHRPDGEVPPAASSAGHTFRISRSLLHIATDWPGHCPNVGVTIRILVEHGADVNARFEGAHAETPLHWAASCNDLEALDALLDFGADPDAPGAVIAGGTPLDDAVAFGQWEAARRLVQRGTQCSLRHAAALGLTGSIEAHFAGSPLPERFPWASPPSSVDAAFWCACHGGQLAAARLLLERGADLNWMAPWDGTTPLDAARRSRAEEVLRWLQSLGARSARE